MVHPMAIGAPMASAGSGGSGSGNNLILSQGWPGAPPPPPMRNEPSPHQWDTPWMGPGSGSGSASTTTYGAIYNPAAPPPSANYAAMASNYSGYGSGRESAYGGQMHPLGIHHSSGTCSIPVDLQDILKRMTLFRLKLLEKLKNGFAKDEV